MEKAKTRKREEGPKLRVLQMKTLEVLLIGGQGSGKSTLADSLIGEESSSRRLASIDSGVGMSLKKAEIDLPSGETIRLCLWDPKVSMLPKEAVQIKN